jgi:hypothetical protein
MRVLERMRVCFLWFRGGWDDCEATDGASRCAWCGDELAGDGTCERCAELEARTLVFFDE